MMTLSVTRSRVAGVLSFAAGVLGVEGWDADSDQRSLIGAIDRAAGCVPGKASQDAEDTTTAAWEALSAHLAVEDPRAWELAEGRTEGDVVAALRGASQAVTS